MFGWIFAGVILFVIALLCAHEILRYRDSQTVRTDLPYPRRRLTRRLGIAVLMVFILLGIQLKPNGTTAVFDMVWYGFCLAVTAILIILILRDLHDASLQVVGEHRRFYEEAEQRIKAVIQSELKAEKKKKK